MTESIVKKYLSLFSALAFSLFSYMCFAQASQLTASVDRDNISLQESFTLTVSADSQTRSQPDFSELRKDFEILNTSNSRNISIINGKTESKIEWRIILAPKHLGTLIIPSFHLDNAISDAIEIHVSKQSQTQTGSDEQIRVAVEINKNNIFVQEQLLLKIKLISQVNLSQAEMQPLDIKNAVVIPLNDKPKQYVSTINGRQHLVLESNYAIFPQESGELIIPSMIYSVVPNNDRDIWSDPFGRNRNNVMRIPTDEQHITVKPVPNSMAGKNWQPANNITLNETWSASLDHLKIGEPVTRTITISADGLTGGQIAPLSYPAIDSLTFYPDQPQNSDAKTDKGVKGTRVETTAIIPNHGGDFVLPEVVVEWWDNNSQTLQTTTLPAKNIHVIGDVTTVAPSINNNAVQTSSDDSKAALQNAPVKTITTNPWLWWASTLFFALTSIALGIYAWQLKNRLAQWQQEKMDEDLALSEKEKDIWDLLKHASANKDAPALRKAVISWAKFQWPQMQIHSLDDIAKLGNRVELTEALKQLDSQLYSSHSQQDWDANQLLHLLNECRKEKKAGKKPEGLKPLYQ